MKKYVAIIVCLNIFIVYAADEKDEPLDNQVKAYKQNVQMMLPSEK